MCIGFFLQNENNVNENENEKKINKQITFLSK